MGTNVTEQALIVRFRQLPAENQQEVLNFAKRLSPARKLPLRSLEGLWAGEGVNITDEDLAEIRREMGGNFPREDFFK